MIEAAIFIVGDDRGVVDGLCEMPALPPVGGHIAVIDRNSNHQILKVEDIVIGAVSKRMLESLPNTAPSGLWITILCHDTCDHPMQLPSE